MEKFKAWEEDYFILTEVLRQLIDKSNQVWFIQQSGPALPLAYKFYLHCLTAYHFKNGTPEYATGLIKTDIPSILTILRAALENFLLFDYLFSQPKHWKEKNIRILQWIISEMKMSCQKTTTSKEFFENAIADIKHKYRYNELSDVDKKRIDKERRPKWRDLLLLAHMPRFLKDGFDIYGFLSGNAHSDFYELNGLFFMDNDQEDFIIGSQFTLLTATMTFMLRSYLEYNNKIAKKFNFSREIKQLFKRWPRVYEKAPDSKQEGQ